jgi:hypothetical protein
MRWNCQIYSLQNVNKKMIKYFGLTCEYFAGEFQLTNEEGRLSSFVLLNKLDNASFFETGDDQRWEAVSTNMH